MPVNGTLQHRVQKLQRIVLSPLFFRNQRLWLFHIHPRPENLCGFVFPLAIAPQPRPLKLDRPFRAQALKRIRKLPQHQWGRRLTRFHCQLSRACRKWPQPCPWSEQTLDFGLWPTNRKRPLHSAAPQLKKVQISIVGPGELQPAILGDKACIYINFSPRQPMDFAHHKWPLLEIWHQKIEAQRIRRLGENR